MRWMLLILPLVLALPARAIAGPEVVATIAPVHSLVARVMAGAGTPHLLVPPAASPHHFALRPSDAAALERAALVFRVGPGIEPWLDRPLESLAAGAQVVRLDRAPGLTRLPRREGARFAPHAHDADHGDHSDPEPHGDRQTDGDVQAGHVTEADVHADGAGHREGEEHHAPAHAPDDAADQHLWLDPENAGIWLDVIARALADADPAHAALYAANADAARAELDTLQAEIATALAPLEGRPFVVFHDAFHYFEHRFGVEAAGAVALSDARPPGPARIAAVRALIRETGAACVFREPQFRPGLVETVVEGTGARVGVLDPTGATLAPGPGLYPGLLRGLAEGLAACLG